MLNYQRAQYIIIFQWDPHQNAYLGEGIPTSPSPPSRPRPRPSPRTSYDAPNALLAGGDCVFCWDNLGDLTKTPGIS